MPIPVPVELDQPAPSGGLFAASRPLPENWQRGISFTDRGCLLPVVMGECPTGDDLKPTQRSDKATFRPVELITAVTCSTLDNFTDYDVVAGAALDSTRDFAMARELLTGAASLRDLGPSSTPNPALVSTATDLGSDIEGTTAAMACLETNLLTANGGRAATLLMPIAVAYQMLADRTLYLDGARWRTVTGSTVIVSPGFDGRPPVDDQSTSVPPTAGDPLYVYAVTAVWAQTGERSILHDVNRAINDVNARAEDIALAAFGPCAVFAVGTSVLACDTEGA